MARSYATAPAEPSKVELPPPEHFKLENGLEVLLQEAHHAPLVALRVAYDIGSRDDPTGHDGLAHLVEHLTYRGSKHLKDLEALELLAQAGVVERQGSTAPDFTEYYHLVPANALELALWVESERMAFTLEHFSESMLNVEREVIAREVARAPVYNQALDQLMLGGVWGHSHVYARPRWARALPNASTLANAQWFFQLGYRPANARLVIVGDFQSSEARALVERHFAPIANPARAFVRAPLPCAAPFEAESVSVREPATFPRYALSWGLDAPFSSTGLAGEMELKLLRRRLEQGLVARQGKALDVRAERVELDCGAFARVDLTLRRAVTPNDVEPDVASARAAVAGFDWTGPLPKLKAKKRLQILADVESPATFSALHMRALRRERRPFDVNAALLALARLQPADFAATKPAFERSVIGKQFNSGVSDDQLGTKMRRTEGQ